MDELETYISSSLKQGKTPEDIRTNLLQGGWDEVLVSQKLEQYTIPTQDASKKKWITIGSVSIAIIIVISLALILILPDSNNNSNPGSDLGIEQFGSDVVTSSVDFCARAETKTILYPSVWSTATKVIKPLQGCRISLFTYNYDLVAQELKDTDRFPDNANFWHDIAERKIENYPYSLDSIYEIQVSVDDELPKTNTIEELVMLRAGFGASNTSEQFYTGDDYEIADYISEPSNGINQRMIIIAAKDRSMGFTLTINRSQSGVEIDQDTIDNLGGFIHGLTELITN